ncbi:threonine synthase [Dactylosporangium matsuzakiense]|uniref:Threonine synthase n=1 Tax=Dactylosporangium matsuzakiense TaxID=53360 RepID=A0A9W6NKW9_9ACTN|nr:threonine synthase [Dactylosporangium matsuzakiense]UWZ46139.1 threonine synthase [Dactylosporangium matsuzakiense]GLL00282.1 threonine synthase [Dactylosporangium matsuzakiense]
MWRGLIEEFRDRLPVGPQTPVVTLHEGNTPLLPAPELSARTGCDVYLKVEGANPTGSFKDRGMTVAVSKALEEGSKAIICASTGNTSASAAAYAARAGITCAVLVPTGKIALGKLAQALVHGARLLQVSGNFDDCLALASKLALDYPVSLVNSVNPDRLQGQKTAAFEIVQALGDAPHIHCLPVGNAGNISAYWMGYQEDHAAGNATRKPRMFGFQASGAAPIVNGAVVREPSTIATAIRIGNPASWTKATDARDESGGLIDAVTDRDILQAYRLLARSVGAFVELGSAASVAGLLQATTQGRIDPGQTIVCTVTGHGLKDPEWAISTAPAPTTIPADPLAAAKALDLA